VSIVELYGVVLYGEYVFVLQELLTGGKIALPFNMCIGVYEYLGK